MNINHHKLIEKMQYLIRFSFILGFVILTFALSAQEDKKLSDIVSISGYIKLLPSVSFSNADDLITNNLIHNRINLKIYFNEKWTGKLEVRNRLLYGESVKLSPSLADMLDIDEGSIDLSSVWWNKKAIIGHSIIDRANINYAGDQWEITLGRQRINWGINLLWNSNDLFNAYNFIDFDYAERPGTDAIRFQYYGASMSSVELAFKPGKDLDSIVLASMYKFNNWKYDFQFIAANYYHDIMFGMGWAGNIKNIGFKGETSYFYPKDNNGTSEKSLVSSVSFDYSFKNGIYINFSSLFNSQGINEEVSQSTALFTTNTLSAKNLMPSKYSHFAQVSGPFNPIFTGSIATMFAQGMNLFFIMPSLAYGIQENWDLDITAQLFFGPEPSSYENLGNGIYLRLWYSY